ncbi:TIR domain-containing adapter molecule 1-like [Xyrauchen texanus]|uniref:TIR domain-containing adapter molecule 1-like n=1 Tax=Xyrauchen texanus TaxID=154827 RepID=UPI0022425671|nr:TIR domain-containing adapter molecule 1-like [Xyrauchen texanus]
MEREHMEPGLAMAIEVLSKATPERLVSLTCKMGQLRAEELVHAMCLILLKRNKDANAKLMANCNSSVANHLAEMVKMHGEGLNSSHFGGFTISRSDTETLLDIARIFAVLVQERLCDKSLRDQAYRTILAKSKNAGSQSTDVDIFEEVRQVCGAEVIDEFPRFTTEMASITDCLTSLDISGTNISCPSPLRTSSICISHSLEISSPTILGPESNTEESKPMTLHIPQESETTTNQDQTPHCPDRSSNSCAITSPKTLKMQDINDAPKPCLDHNGSSQVVTSESTNAENVLDFSSAPNSGTKLKAHPVNSSHCANDCKPPTQAKSVPPAEPSYSEEDETFYAFVILHGPEDADEAQRLRDKLESITSGQGATFSEDFEEPGRSALRCMEDAIDNSAFTLLLLTKNFDTNLSATTTDSALMNSLEKCHKTNSVIPLLPRDNRLPRQRFPLVLRTKVCLDENSAFERKALKVMAPNKVASQKVEWMKEQRNKKAIEQQRRLLEENSRNVELRRQTERLERMMLESEKQHDGTFYAGPPLNYGPMQMAPQHPAWQPSCIHIENSQNIIIGNNSTMIIDHSEHSSED